MENRILTVEGWQGRIRDALGVDEAYLPDAALSRPEVITTAEARIIRRVPDWQDLTGDERVFLEAAVIYQAAIQVVDAMPSRLPKKHKGPGAEFEVEVDWAAVKDGLADQREQALIEITDDAGSPGLSHFGTVRPKDSPTC